MTAAIIHEINNPLAIVDATAESIMREIQNPEFTDEQLMKHATKIREMVLRIVGMTKGLRSFAVDTTNFPFSCEPLAPILRESVALAQLGSKSRPVHVEIVLPENSVHVVCNRSEISQVFLNLLNNAFEAIDPQPLPWVKVESWLDGHSVVVEVTDSGRPAPELPLKRMGLAFTLSKRIIESYGGTLVLDRECLNTCFVVRLPMKKTP